MRGAATNSRKICLQDICLCFLHTLCLKVLCKNHVSNSCRSVHQWGPATRSTSLDSCLNIFVSHSFLTWILWGILRYIWLLSFESGSMDVAEDPEICRCWDMNPKTWILQRTLRYNDAETWIGDMDIAEVPEIQRCWDINAKPWIGHMHLAEDPEVWRCWDVYPKTRTYAWVRRHGSGNGSSNTYGCWHMNTETWILQRSRRFVDAETWMLGHDTHTWILQRILRFEDAETWTRRHGSCRGPWHIKMLRHESDSGFTSQHPGSSASSMLPDS